MFSADNLITIDHDSNSRTITQHYLCSYMQNMWLQTYEKGSLEVVFEVLPVWEGILEKLQELWWTDQTTKDNW